MFQYKDIVFSVHNTPGLKLTDGGKLFVVGFKPGVLAETRSSLYV
jgi:hypothetical protein